MSQYDTMISLEGFVVPQQDAIILQYNTIVVGNYDEKIGYS